MSPRNEPIAIIGSGCRFPGGANTPSKLWELLRQPHDLLRKVPGNRFASHAFYHPDPTHHGTTNVQESYFLDEDPYQFDAQFFNIQPMEAESIDPQQRILLETVYDSLEAAGVPLEKLRGSSTAVYVGLMCDDWSGILTRDWDSFPTYSATGMARSIISNRISYFFDWHGPSMTIDTACSSSLVAVHQAVQTLRSGESRVAVAAGANLILSPGMYIAESKLRMLSPNGRSRMWDKDADGYARGEGIASVVMKTLSHALEDGDYIQCIIRETGVNQDGRTSGITVPSSTAQTVLIRETYEKAGLDACSDRPQFFQAHGTGTQAGDPQEAEAICNAFFPDGSASGEGKLYVGSIKTVIGHTEGTAGVASLIASALAIQHGVVPPNMHFNELNPKISPFYDHLEIPIEAKPWPALVPGQARRVSVNSFGFGGTNAHAIIESYDVEERKACKLSLLTPLVFSASSESSLKATLAAQAEFLKGNLQVDLRDLAWTLQTRRSALPYKKAIAGLNTADLCSRIDSELDKPEAGDRGSSFKATDTELPRLLGVFTGQGAQWPTMGRELVRSSAYVRERLASLDRALAQLSCDERPSWSIADELMAPDAASHLSDAAYSQPLCTAVQIVLVDLLSAAGIHLHAVVGHSSGEIAAAYASGVVSANDAIRIAYYRGFHSKCARSPNGRKGAMMAVGTSAEDAQSFCSLEAFQGRIQVAALNSSSSITISGDDDAVDEAIEVFKDEQLFARKLRVDTAYHSFHMHACAEPYLRSIRLCNINTQDRKRNGTRWFSSVLPGVEMGLEELTEHYWVDNMTNPVLFSTAVAAALAEAGPFKAALEIGPHPALQSPCLATIEEAGGTGPIPYHALLARGKHDVLQLSSALGFVWCNLGPGFVDFDAYERIVSGNNDQRRMIANLPAYPFNHQRAFLSQSRVSGAFKLLKEAPHPLLGSRCIESSTSQGIQWRNILRPREIQWLHGHRLQGQIVFPATGYVVMAVEALKVLAGEASIGLFEVSNLAISRAIAFNDDNSGIDMLFGVNLAHSDGDSLIADFTCYSSPSAESPMTMNARGRATVHFFQPAKATLPQHHFEEFGLVEVDMDRFYSSLEKVGYNYSTPFRGISQIKRKADFASGIMEDQTSNGWEDQLLVHPGMLDTALQTAFAAFCSPGDERLWSLHVPTEIRRIIINPLFCSHSGKSHLPFQASVTTEPTSGIRANIQLFGDDDCNGFIQIEDVGLVPFSPPSQADDSVLFSTFEYRVAGPNGKLAARNERPSEYEMEMAYDLERVSYFYLKRLVDMVSEEEKEKTLLHYQRLLHWASHVVGIVSRGEHAWVKLEFQQDTHETIVEILNRYRERVDVRLIEAVGENLVSCIRDNSNILEYMTEGGLLSHFYEEGLGLKASNRWIARMVWQVAHRYPHMHILEIGAGTGGSTGPILRKLGSAFSLYTYTDISSAFFEPARERFKDYASRMIFKTFDMEKSPSSQGFVEGSYDMVVASNVLHATNRLDDMMANVRKLLKPGGYLINLEVVNNEPLRNGLPMGGLPGWWVGADDGRPWGPTLTLTQWDSLLRTAGFAGVETATPDYDELHPFSVFAAQALDHRITTLRKPLLSRGPAMWEALVVVGGKSIEVCRLAEDVVELLRPFFGHIARIDSVEAVQKAEVAASSAILSLAELDEPLLRTVTAAKLDGLKKIWNQARGVLWVTRQSRAEEPHSYIMVGIGRAVRFEHPNINLQMLDLDKVDGRSAQTIAETMVRLQLLDEWKRREPLTDLLWSSEPEIFIEDGTHIIPRLFPNREQNLRRNSERRQITRYVDSRHFPVALIANGPVLEVCAISPLRVPTPRNGSSSDIRVTHSLLRALRLRSVGHVTLCCGTLVGSNTPVIAFSDSSESLVSVPDRLVMPTDPEADVAALLVSAAANLVAHEITTLMPASGAILIHEASPVLVNALRSQLAEKTRVLSFTTSRIECTCEGVTTIHQNSPQGLIAASVPPSVSLYVDLSGNSSVGQRIAKVLPPHCQHYQSTSFFATAPNPQPAESVPDLERLLKVAVSGSKAAEVAVNVIRLGDGRGRTVEDVFSVVDWRTDSAIPVHVRPIDTEDIFRPDRTYLMVGLSGELGQSLCSWMVRHGARYVVLTSRNPNVSERWIRSHEASGAVIKVYPLDITSRESLNHCHHEISRTLPPIAGVANGAMILEDVLFQNMSVESMVKVLEPKVKGTTLLDELFRTPALDFFILFSSITAVVGNSGQTNYIAANMFMTALASQRKKRGLAGSVIDISSLVGIGYVERSETFSAEYFSKIGYTNISEQDLHQIFAEAILAGRPGSQASAEIVTGFAPAYADVEIKAQYRSDLKFCHFILQRPSDQQRGDQKTTASVKAQLSGAKDTQEVYSILKESFMARLRQILQLPGDENLHEAVSLVEQGVDSLVAVEIRSWFLKELEIDVPVLKILGPTLISDILDDVHSRIPASALPNAIQDDNKAQQKEVGNEVKSSQSLHGRDLTLKTATEVAEKMSFGQSRFWFLNRLLNDKTTFNMAFAVRITGSLRVAALEDALKTVSQKHEALRTRFFSTGDLEETPMQGVLSKSLVSLRTRSIDDESEALAELDDMRNHVWDLDDWETMRVTLLSMPSSTQTHYLLAGCHHIAMDGISFQLFFHDLETAYLGQPLEPCPAEHQYRAFSAQQLRDHAEGRMQKDIEFYRRLIPANQEPIPLFPFARVRTRKTLERYSSHRADFRLDAGLTGRIKRKARENRATPFHFYLAALQALLLRLLPDAGDFFIGIADANRTDAKFVKTLGFFLNLLPVHFARGFTSTVKKAVQDARDKVHAALAHSNVPFDVLLNELGIGRAGEHSPVFQVFMDYRQGVQERTRFADCEASGERWYIAQHGYDVSLDVIENAAGDSLLTLKLQESMYSSEDADMVLRIYVNLLEEFAADTELVMDGPVPWPSKDVEEALRLGQGPEMELGWAATLCHRIDEMIQIHGSAIALKDGRTTLSYAEMGKRIDEIASALTDAGVHDGAAVAVFQMPSTDWICSMLAVLRAGATYVPLDLKTPLPRLAKTAGLCRPSIIVAHGPTRSLVPQLESPGAATIDVSAVPGGAPTAPNRAKPRAAAAILFTSGSTGVPKGVVLTHANLRAQAEGYSRAWDVAAAAGGGGGGVVLQQSAFGFDFSLDQTFAALAHGGCLYVVPARGRGDPAAIGRLMAAERVTYTAATPSEYELWLRHAGAELARCRAWRCAFAGGERLGAALARRFGELGLAGLRLFNNYGPAETTVASTKGEVAYRRLGPDAAAAAAVLPAGAMLPNYAAYIVDRHLRPLPAGVPGEIVIGGAGVAGGGYLAMAELTRQKFLPDPFVRDGTPFAANGWRTMYRTGDRGRLLRGGGALVCEGRIDGDTQVKIRGFRVELGDVESTVLDVAAGALAHAVVGVRGEGASAFLVAHVTFAPQHRGDGRRGFLDRLGPRLPLPEHMRPAVFVALDALPLTLHLKVDRQALQELDIPVPRKRGADSGLTGTQKRLSSLWQQVCPAAARVAAATDFFSAGGNSILLVRLQALIKSQFGVALRLIDLMSASQLHEMASRIDQADRHRDIDWAEETRLPELAGERLPPAAPKRDRLTVILTGATGYLGGRLLARLAGDGRVSAVHCVGVRTKGAGEPAARLAVGSDKIRVHRGDVSQAGLGLPAAGLAALLRSADAILHCAADRSFWDGYEALRGANVAPLKTLIGAAAPRRVPLIFLSSGAVRQYDATEPPVDGSGGYVASKWAAERVLFAAAERGGFDVRIHRPSAAAAAAHDAPRAAVAQLVRLAKEMRVRPEFEGLRGHVDLIPAAVVVESIFASLLSPARSSGSPEVVNHEGQFRLELRSLAEAAGGDDELRSLPTMSALDWVGEAKKKGLDYFVTSHFISMQGKNGTVVSTR